MSVPSRQLKDDNGAEQIGEVQTTPTANTLLRRLKDLLTGIVLSAGSALIGKVGIDQTTPGTTNRVDIGAALPAGTNNIGGVDVLTTTITKTIQTELLAITKIAANTQQKSSELDLTNIKKVAILIDHGRTATTAFVVAGTEYRIEVSQKATGNDTWQPIASVVADITAASEITADGDEAAAQTLIEIGATTPVVGDIVFWENNTDVLDSEWMRVIAIVGGTSFTILDGLNHAQEAAKKIYNKAQQFPLSLDVSAFTRLRVVVNNANGTTNVQIASRIACITEA